MFRACWQIAFGLLLLILGVCTSAYALQIINNTDGELLDVTLTTPGYREHFEKIQANGATGHIFSLRGLPKNATLTWCEQDSGNSFRVTFEVSDLPLEQLQPRFNEIIFVITGPRTSHLEFNLEAGSRLIERYIPDEYPNAKRARLATEKLAQLAGSGAEQGFSKLIAECARLNPISILDPIPLRQTVGWRLTLKGK